ncbi:protein BIC1-like [Cucurbita maxima]|uniref:Protein BIC1-like n=1 Tax=Cucurbita maxima TaxID=3661 RepID=A0A6J1IYG7_CUCMA|nr:protein BIC1-like [Cucurbita maxima]
MRAEVRTSSREMDFQGAGSCLHQYSLSPPPPPAQNGGIEQELRCLVSSFGGGKRSESDVKEDDGVPVEVPAAEAASEEEEEGGRERLKRHRREVAGRVWIPEIWGQEELLKDWIDCFAFDACLFPTGIGSARAALIEEGRRANNGGFRPENRC